MKNYSIGIFDSGYGGLTVMQEIVKSLPHYDYIYLGDNARTPYGSRSFETVYKYTLQAVTWLFNNGCQLVIIACNTASSKALRTIQQRDLLRIAPQKRVLGVIRPLTETIGKISKSKHIGIFATAGTVKSNSYPIEIAKYFPELLVTQQACPMLVPMIENNDFNNPGAEYFIQKYADALIEKDRMIDTIILGCTHYPIILKKIKSVLPPNITLVNQGAIVAESLKDYLKRHKEIDSQLWKTSDRHFYTTETSETFDELAELFYCEPIRSEQVQIEN